MRKIYALLLFFILNLVHSQTTMLSDYHSCPDNFTNNGTFDLTAKSGEMMLALDPGDYTFDYFHNLNDAGSGNQPIVNPSAYVNSTNPEQIYARAINTQTQEAFYFVFLLVVDQAPQIFGPANLTFCSDTELPIYSLYDAVPQLVSEQLGLTFTFFDHATGDLIDSNDAFNFVPTSLPLQQIDVLIENNCAQIVGSITLHTNDCTPPQPCPAPIGLSVSNVTETTVLLSWMSQPASYYLIYLTPAGAPDPLPTTAATAIAQAVPFTMTGLIPDVCYAFYVRSACSQFGIDNFSEWIGPYNFCTVPNCENNGECVDHLALVSFVDTNNNGIKDSGEVPFDMGHFNYDINNSGASLFGYSNSGNPFLIFNSSPNDSYDLSFSVNAELAPYFSCSTTYNDILIAAGSGSQTFYFPVEQLQACQDLAVDIVPSGAPRPGFTYVNYIKYKNKGVSTIASGTVYFLKDDALTISSASPSASNTFANGISVDFTNLAPQEERTIIITLQVPTIPTVNLGQSLTSTAIIEPALTDSFPLNNTAHTTQLIVGSYDPNLKTEAHGGKVAMDTFTTEDDLTYTIQFENTGTASAEFIRVEDILDAGLNPDTVEMLSASHPYNMRRIGNKLVWNFYNINLPTTASNPAQSHGYVQFKVKPTAGYTIGTIIPNAADIYFDYNPAIVTDTFETYFVETLSNDVFANNAFFMAPNPANSIVRLGWKDSEASIENIEIRDVLGKSILKIQPSSSEIAVDVSLFSKGIYFVEMTTKSQLKITKKLIVN